MMNIQGDNYTLSPLPTYGFVAIVYSGCTRILHTCVVLAFAGCMKINFPYCLRRKARLLLRLFSGKLFAGASALDTFTVSVLQTSFLLQSIFYEIKINKLYSKNFSENAYSVRGKVRKKIDRFRLISALMLYNLTILRFKN